MKYLVKSIIRKIINVPIPGGPIQPTNKNAAPFDYCDCEQDYEIAWKFFKEKYGKV